VLGKTLLEYQIERLRGVKLASDVVIATSTNSLDDSIVKLCETLNVTFYRGSEEDVLSRYYEAAIINSADVVVRVTSDCPVIDPRIIDKAIQYYLDNAEKCDLVSNCLERTYPRGMDTEVFSFKALSEASHNAKKRSEREHVTSYLYDSNNNYKTANILYSSNQSGHRWTVDTREDFQLIELIISTLYPDNKMFSVEECLALLKQHPEWSKINTHVNQKNIN
jgi:spore coat polysaccharide biosynthesis protein SpsF